jgi:hypothetical protein
MCFEVPKTIKMIESIITISMNTRYFYLISKTAATTEINTVFIGAAIFLVLLPLN